ncbi:PTS transporter subunit IIC [Brachybacterium alimentarium]|uniref:PTS transporter subunit IIC n=1 Tax=Brachybacterium alimentarium TaxID=47845 RepID=UPI000BB9927E|nr:PTS transporter subunit IIC [Brachybacterium alimentarium]PCC32381.1 PTS ascorbate transporter subunit IIC [Brachybacterium alimentarium]RCS79798.1 PTS ascorbate transporter subunit IIC [Brachybacterium alimentarium]
MGTFEEVVRVITDNLFAQVSILIGLIALVGLILQRKPFDEVVAGALRATIGVVILNIGVEIFTGGLSSFQVIVSSAMGLDPPEATSTLAEFSAGSGSVVPLIIAGGFVVHLALVRIFPAARFVYLTGHLMYWMSVVIAASLVEAFGDVNRWALAGVGSILIGCYWVLQPLWTAPLMRKVMGDEEVGLAHTDSLIAIASGYGARALKLGDPAKHDSEKVRLPKPVSFFKDINVSTATIIGVIMLVAILFADSGVVQEQMGDATVLPWVWAILQALRFAAGIAILLFGVRMFLAEIVPAFKGLSEKALPGTKPALDLPVVFTRAPTSVMIGFLASTFVFLVLMGIFAATGWFVLVPPMIMLFFGGGAGGVFGNAVAGWRGAIFGGVLNGVVLAVGQAIGWSLYAGTAPELATLADADWYAVGWALIGLGSLFAPLGAWAIWVIAAIVLAVTIVVLVVLGRRLPAPEQTPAPPSGDRVPTAVGVATDGADGADTLTEPVSTTLSSNARPTPLDVLAVCGAGMGSSLILRTTAEKAFDRMGVDATLRHTDVGSARGEQPDMVVAQQTYLEELGDIAPVMVPIDNFINVDHVEGRILDALEKEGWR